ncbi:DUF4173 domain-containing protein [Nocardia sp. NBC_01730]|uniref:DUF4153 domain-containing protein n=1 Tax=Nocardia sp. NBC_01730 TaxID=2975998 RepID=UPI002E12A1F7|nr:DUF4173 domain-containing protein [Nocardia sp. NBC_01730]
MSRTAAQPTPLIRMPPPKWRRVACPPGVVPAALVSGLAAAILVPGDRPGIGWVLAGAVAAMAVFLVDRNARRSAVDLTVEPGTAEGTAREPKTERQAVPGLIRRLRGPSGRARCVGHGDRVVLRHGGPEPAVVQRRENAERAWWTTLALALLAVGAFRAAGWLFALCVVAACVAGSLAVVGRRSANGVLYDTIAVPLEALAAVPWVYAGMSRVHASKAKREWRFGLSLVVTVALLAVFVPLLGSADATFATLLATVTPDLDAPSVARWIVLFAVVTLGALGAMFVLAGPPLPAASAGSGQSLRRPEWALPVGALAVLFAAFVVAQFVALFGGDGYVRRTAGLTYAEYARSGFWQLSAVTVLTLAVLMLVLRWAAQDTAVDRLWLRGLLTAVSVLALIIVASALGRMWTYQQAYGFTVLRLVVEVCELWLGLVYLQVLVAVARLERSWLPRAVLGSAMVTVLALAVLDPERLIADKNIDRWQQGRSFDADYLGTLSPDILPATDRLPEPLRTDLRARLRADLEEDSWQSWNRSRANAR